MIILNICISSDINGPTDGKIETMVTVDSMFFVHVFIPVRLFIY